MTLSKVFFLWVFSLLGNIVCSQLSASDVYLLQLENNQIKKISFLNGFNRGVYNNQAVFMSEEEILLSSELDEGQTDIVKLNLKSKSYKRLTSTKESEFSPRANDQGGFTVVRVEEDGVTQTLWEYPLDLSSIGNRLLDNVKGIGYYAILANFKVALFVIEDDRFNLKIANLRNGKIEEKAQNIGRCFQVNKAGELIFLAETSDGKFRLKSFNPVNQNIKDISQALPESQDFCLYGTSESILMAKGSVIFKFDNLNETWLQWLDLSSFGINNITRIESNKDKIVIINSI